jgi:hypothetical protein
MSETKFTKGEWKLGEIDTGESITIEVDGAPLAVVNGAFDFPCLEEPEKFIEEYEANAYLMVAAPTLFESLSEVTEILSRIYRGESVAGQIVDAIDSANAALRAAQGGKQ